MSLRAKTSSKSSGKKPIGKTSSSASSKKEAKEPPSWWVSKWNAWFGPENRWNTMWVGMCYSMFVAGAVLIETHNDTLVEAVKGNGLPMEQTNQLS